MQYDIFISYRRDGGKEIARPLKEALSNKGYKVFLDFDELNDGLFNERIIRAIDEAPVFMLVLSRNALDRCVNEDDWVRKEIEYAILKNKQIIPVNPDKQFRSFPEGLPDSIALGLSHHQISVLDTEQLFSESLNKIDNNRIKPVLHSLNKKSRKRTLFKCLIVLLAIMCVFAAIAIVKGNQDKIFEQALAYYNGNGEPVDLEKAIKLFSRLGKSGNNEALFNLGVIYSEKEEYETAAAVYEKAARKGFAPACRTLATYYLEGKGVPKDENKAYELTVQAASAGDIPAIYNLGLFSYSGVGTSIDKESAYKYFQYAANQGDLNSMIRISEMLNNGEGTLKNSQEAFGWLERAANAGSLEAASKLAINYLDGVGVDQNVHVGIQLLIKTGDSGYESSYISLANIFLEGNYVPKDIFLSKYYLEKVSKENEYYDYISSRISESLNDSQLFVLNMQTIDSSVEICGVERKPKETTIYLSFKASQSEYKSMWYSIDKDVVLQAAGRSYGILRTINCPYSPEQYIIEYGETALFGLVFPAIPESVNTFDILEPGESGWKFKGIKLN